MEKQIKRRKPNKVCRSEIDDQVLNYVVNKEIMQVFDFKDDTIMKLADAGEINLASLFI